MIRSYSNLVSAYIQGGQEEDLAAIAALGTRLLRSDVPFVELAGMHERALLDLGQSKPDLVFRDVVLKTTACLSELMIAYSLADQKRKEMIEIGQTHLRERQRLEALGQIAGGVAHEFNNLLQPVLGMAEMAFADSSDPELRSQLSVIIECARQATAVAKGILTTARQQTPVAGLRPLADLLRQSIEFLRAVMPGDVIFDLSIDCGDECVVCEESEFSQILLNLVRNAVDAMGKAGTVRLTLSRETRGETGDALKFSVIDTGTGMSSEIATRAFQPFFTTKTPSQGTGLGLSIVMAITLSWGATLETQTSPGEGTRISIFFPVISTAA